MQFINISQVDGLFSQPMSKLTPHNEHSEHFIPCLI